MQSFNYNPKTRHLVIDSEECFPIFDDKIPLKSVQSLTLGESIHTLGSYWFKYLVDLREVLIKGDLKSASPVAFKSCRYLGLIQFLDFFILKEEFESLATKFDKSDYTSFRKFLKDNKEKECIVQLTEEVDDCV